MALATLGTFAIAQQTPQLQERKVNMEQKHQQKMDAMKQELNLTDAQMAQLKAMHDQKQADRKDMQKKNMEQRKAKMEAHKAEMKKILTPEQYQKWEAKRAEKMQAHQMRMKDGKATRKAPAKN